MSTLRAQCFRPVITLTPDLKKSYIPMKPRPEDLSTVDVHIKRADGTRLGEHDYGPKGRKNSKCNPWLLRYIASDYDGGAVGFEWDEDLFDLPPGRYYAELQVNCVACARFEIHVPLCAHLLGGTATNITEE